jgi:hypothetical protein
MPRNRAGSAIELLPLRAVGRFFLVGATLKF